MARIRISWVIISQIFYLSWQMSREIRVWRQGRWRRRQRKTFSRHQPQCFQPPWHGFRQIRNQISDFAKSLAQSSEITPRNRQWCKSRGIAVKTWKAGGRRDKMRRLWKWLSRGKRGDGLDWGHLRQLDNGNVRRWQLGTWPRWEQPRFWPIGPSPVFY